MYILFGEEKNTHTEPELCDSEMALRLIGENMESVLGSLMDRKCVIILSKY